MAQKEELWFGTYSNENGKVLQGRYNVIKQGRALTKIVLAQYGKSAIEFKIIKNDTVRRFVETSWPNKPNRIATLIQYANGYYAGNFENGVLFTSAENYKWVNGLQVWASGTVDRDTGKIELTAYAD